MKELEELFADTDIPIAGVMGIAEALDDAHLKSRDMVIEVDDPMLGKLKLVGDPIKLSENEPILNVPSPMLGQHTDDILRELGYSEDEINKFKTKKVV